MVVSGIYTERRFSSPARGDVKLAADILEKRLRAVFRFSLSSPVSSLYVLLPHPPTLKFLFDYPCLLFHFLGPCGLNLLWDCYFSGSWGEKKGDNALFSAVSVIRRLEFREGFPSRWYPTTPQVTASVWIPMSSSIKWKSSSR